MRIVVLDRIEYQDFCQFLDVYRKERGIEVSGFGFQVLD